MKAIEKFIASPTPVFTAKGNNDFESNAKTDRFDLVKSPEGIKSRIFLHQQRSFETQTGSNRFQARGKN